MAALMAALTVMGVLMIMITFTGKGEWVCSQFLQMFQNIRGKVMSQEANKLHMPFSVNSI